QTLACIRDPLDLLTSSTTASSWGTCFWANSLRADPTKLVTRDSGPELLPRFAVIITLLLIASTARASKPAKWTVSRFGILAKVSTAAPDPKTENLAGGGGAFFLIWIISPTSRCTYTSHEQLSARARKAPSSNGLLETLLIVSSKVPTLSLSGAM